MAVYEQTYKPFAGALTPAWSRFAVVPRHAYRTVFQSKLFVAFFAACFIPPLVFSVLVYLKHNAAALAITRINVADLLAVNNDFFYYFMLAQGIMSFFLTVLVGPPLVARDLSNNALPLYLSRPFSRTEYVGGKAATLLILQSVVTWVPGLLLFAFQSYMEGWAWFKENWRIAAALWCGSWVWMILLTLLALSLSALLKWRAVATGALVAMFFIPAAFGGIINEMFQTRLGHLLSPNALINSVWRGLFRNFEAQSGSILIREGRRVVGEIPLYEPPLWASWLVLFLTCGVCALILSRKVRAYEVVK
jgi:ABC-2 type transport system permease protein